MSYRLMTIDAATGTTYQYQDVFQHANTLGIVGVCLLLAFLLFSGLAGAGAFMATKDARRIKQAKDAGQPFEKRTTPKLRFIIPVMILSDALLIVAPILYDAMTVQPQTVKAMQTNVKEKYGADLELVSVGPNKKLMQASSPDKPEQFVLTFPDGTTGIHSVRFDRQTSEPFVLDLESAEPTPTDAASSEPSSDASFDDSYSTPSPESTENY